MAFLLRSPDNYPFPLFYLIKLYHASRLPIYPLNILNGPLPEALSAFRSLSSAHARGIMRLPLEDVG
jgi:hypothetical protein